MFLDFIAHFASDDNEYRWSSTFGIRMSWWDSMTVPDTAGTGGNVAAGVEHGQMRAFQRQAESSREQLREALSALDRAIFTIACWFPLASFGLPTTWLDFWSWTMDATSDGS